jgi:glycosyltransferase involved in cell wall biosynthesis
MYAGVNEQLEKNLLFVTGFNPLSYRRPLLAKKAFPQLKIYHFSKLKRMGLAGNLLLKYFLKIAKVEGLICKKSRSGGDYYISAVLRDLLASLEFKGLQVSTVVALNPYLASRIIWGTESTVILDWMDVWMTPEGGMNPLDVATAVRANGVIFWSKPMMELITRRIRLKKYTYIPHGVDLSVFDPLKYGRRDRFVRQLGMGDRFVLLYSGGVWRINGIDLQGTDKMLKAFSLALRKLNKAILLLQVPKLDDSTLVLIKRLNLSSKVKVLGPLPYASFLRQSAFAAADVLLAPSSKHPTAYYAERIKLFQYMAAGRAIVAERTPGSLSALGGSAFFVELDDIEGMADAIVELASDKELREELGARARERARLFEWEKLALAYRSFILEVANF